STDTNLRSWYATSMLPIRQASIPTMSRGLPRKLFASARTCPSSSVSSECPLALSAQIALSTGEPSKKIRFKVVRKKVREPLLEERSTSCLASCGGTLLSCERRSTSEGAQPPP